MEEKIPNYKTSRTDLYLNFILGSSDTFPQNPNSRLEKYLYYLCKYGSNIGLKAKKYEHLPEEGKGNILYLVPKENGEDHDICAEYLWIDGAFELVGSTSINLVDYLQKFVVYSEGTINSSTLPAILVPNITVTQLSQIITAFSQEKLCVVKTEDENFVVNQSDSANNEIKFWYHGYYLTYTLEGNSVVVSYINIEQIGDIETALNNIIGDN